MARLEDLKPSISKLDPTQLYHWMMALNTSRHTPKIIHKKKTATKSGTGKTRGPKKAKTITTRSGSKAIAATLTKEQRKKLAEELMNT